MIPFYILYLRVLGQPARERHGEIVAERADFSTLVGEVVDEFAVFAIFARKDFAKLEDWSERVSGYWVCLRIPS